MSLRYRVLPGTQGVFHLRYYPLIQRFHPVIDWHRDGYELDCWGNVSDEMRQLGQIVEANQRQQTGQPGGKFLIDEFNRILMPTTGSQPEHIGDFDYFELSFMNSLDGSEIDLDDDYDLDPGDTWDKPYIGLVYVFGADHQIRFETSGQTECPHSQDQNLIATLRRLRPGGGRILVNPAGIVPTKVQRGFDWIPIYVGRINYQNWFQK